MKIKLFFLLIAYSGMGIAQGTWNQKANFGGTARRIATGFSIGNKGYIGTGLEISTMNQDFWEWDQVTNVWTQKAITPGTVDGAVGFSIGQKGYIGTGYDGIYRQYFWEYDPTSNTWTQKASFPGAARNFAVGFSIGTKGYIGTGYASLSYFNDFWEWDQVTNTWTQKANFGGTARRNAVGFSIGNKGYIGTGYDGTYKQDFWEWNQATNSWTQKASFSGAAVYGAFGFSIGTKGYIGMGTGTNGATNYLAEWDQATNVWTQKTDFPGTARTDAVGFSIGNKGYIGTGNMTQDFWEFNPACFLNLSGTTSHMCIGGSVTLSATYTPSSNHIIYNWAPSLGLTNTTSANPVASPTVATTYSVVVQDTILQCMAASTYSIGIYPIYSISTPITVCRGQLLSLCASGGINYSWSTMETTSCIETSPSATTTYTVDISDAQGCHASGTTTAYVNCTGSSLCGNQDFETGTFQNWTGLSGNRQSYPTVISWTGGLHFQGNDVSSASPAQHTVLTKNKLDSLCIDPNTGKPDILMTALVPGGGNYSIRLGNKQAGSGVEKLQVFFTPTLSDSLFDYLFACVFESSTPPHNYFLWPAFVVNVYDQGNTIIPGLSDTVYGEKPGGGFITSVATSQNGQPILYKPWSNVLLNLSKYIGQTIRIDFMNLDCATGGHFGYTYLDVSCNAIFTLVNNKDAAEQIFSVYPNPAKGVFTLKISNLPDRQKAERITNIEIYNVMGEKVYEQVTGQQRSVTSTNSNLTAGGPLISIDLSAQPTGVYFIHVKNIGGSDSYRETVKKIIKE